MHNGSMCLIASDGIERDIAIERLFGTERGKFLVDRDFRLSSSLNGRFQPTQEFCHRDTVFQHGRFKTFNLCSVLDGFHALDWRFHLYYLTGDLFIKRIVNLIRIEQDVILKIILQTFCHCLVRCHPYPFGFKISLNLGGKLHLIYI